MTRDEFTKLYPFAENLTEKNLKELVLFIMMALLDITMNTQENSDDKKIAVFFAHVKSLLDENRAGIN